METESQLEDLLLQWEKDPSLTPSELCRNYPSLLSQVRESIALRKKLGWLEHDLDTSAPLRLEGLTPFKYKDKPVPGHKLVAFLGSGGFGEVWKVKGPGGTRVALKIIPMNRFGKKEIAGLRRMKTIRHANVLSITAYWPKPDWLFVAMELADRSLSERMEQLKRDGQSGFPVPELYRYMSDAAKGIDFMNRLPAKGNKRRHRLIHADIKPANLLIFGNSLKVADFGLVKPLVSGVVTETSCRTRDYASPEALKGILSSRSDQFSLAVTYCQLRGGRLPFEPGDWERKKPDLTMLPELERRIVARALASDPGDRWRSCTAFVREVHARLLDLNTRRGLVLFSRNVKRLRRKAERDLLLLDRAHRATTGPFVQTLWNY